jgi:mRNA interferase RelE/StbE
MTERRKYAVEISPVVLKTLNRLPKFIVVRIAGAIEGLASDPRPRGCKKLKGRGDKYRLRVDDWHVVYSVEDDRLMVWVLDVGHRREIYRDR